MELLIIFPRGRDDKISYAKESNNKNWAAEQQELFSCIYVEENKKLIENKKMERRCYRIGTTCFPKNRTSQGLSPVVEQLIKKIRWVEENKNNPCNENQPNYKLETPLGA
jgi:hypothetical protein